MDEKSILLILLVVRGGLGKHVFVNKEKTWPDAQAYCRQHCTDLSFVDSQSDLEKLQGTPAPGDAWIGLYRNSTLWKWSGGGNLTYKNWGLGQPDDFGDSENNAQISTDGSWNDRIGTTPLPFYCFNITIVGARKTWEEALEHCRGTDGDLGSLSSETQHLLATRAIVQRGSTVSERVWMGLRYLGERWLWVNGEPMRYQAWLQAGDQNLHQCPNASKRCGALTKQGHWENWDCADKLHFICD